MIGMVGNDTGSSVLSGLHPSPWPCNFCLTVAALTAGVCMQVAILGLLQHLPHCWWLLQPADPLHQQPQVALLLTASAAGNCPVHSVLCLCAGGICTSGWGLCLGPGLLDSCLVCGCSLPTAECGTDHGDHVWQMQVDYGAQHMMDLFVSSCCMLPCWLL